MTEDNTQAIVTLNFKLQSAKGRTASLLNEEQKATTPEEISRLRKERQQSENNEAALVKEIRELQGERKNS